MNKRVIAKVCLAIPAAAFILIGCASTSQTSDTAPATEEAAPAEEEAAAEAAEEAAPAAESTGDWKVFQGDVMPDQSPLGFTTMNTKGEPAVTTIIDDAEVAGNKLMQITSPVGPDNKLCWGINLDDLDPEVGGTIAFRVKASELAPEAMILDIEIRDGVNRDRLVGKGDGTIKLDKSGTSAEFDPNTWHVFRITYLEKDGAMDINVYIDENSTPLFSGQSTEANDTKLFRLGDGSGNDYASSIYDWVVWNNTGAFGPDVALPAGLQQ